MRINKYVAQATGLGRRSADKLLTSKRLLVNGQLPSLGQEIDVSDKVHLDGKLLKPTADVQTIMLHKPVGYVVSRDGQGSNTIYDLLPPDLHKLKPVGRLDKDSSGLLLLTNDGQLANQLTHPSFVKDKLYQVELDKALDEDLVAQLKHGVRVDDYTSRLALKRLDNPPKAPGTYWQITMREGRNRQIRRTFEAVGYRVVSLHRYQIGDIKLGSLKVGGYKSI